MGKKSKKLNKVQDNQLPSNNVVQLEPEEMNVNSETISQTNTSTDSVKKSKKKNKKRDSNGTIIEDASVQIKSDETNESNTLENPTATKIKKAKKKKHNKNNEEELCEEVQNDTDTNKLNEEQLDVPKKKKKKSKLLDEDKPLETCVVEDRKPQRVPKEEKNNSSLNEPNLVQGKTPNKHNDTNQKKGKNKAKTGAPVLNDEESQVTEEAIDRFIDELGEEDNEQYEDWIKLLDARLSKKQQTE